MSDSPHSLPPEEQPDVFTAMLSQARDGDAEAVGKILEDCRDYLLLIANQDLDKNLQRKIGASDLVQESMLTAQVNIDRFEGQTKAQFLAWLRSILVNDVRHWRRHWKGTQKRALYRETDLANSQKLNQEPSDALFTPSTQAAADEEEWLLSEAMQQLPENYQQILRLRNWEDLSFPEIGQRKNCTSGAARKLWLRAILHLKDVLAKKWPELDFDFHNSNDD